MRQRKMLAVALATMVIAAGASGAPDRASAGKAPQSGPPVIKVGAASRSILPTVDGSHDYLDGVVPDPNDPFSPGLFVPEWDQGRVAVGNGDPDSYWVHDDMEVTAVAFEEQQGKHITVVVASNLYMIFGADADVDPRSGRRPSSDRGCAIVSTSRSPPTTTTTGRTRRSTSTTSGTS